MPFLPDVLPFTFGVEVEYNGFPSCGFCDGDGWAECPCCDGYGLVTCHECEHEDACPECEGDGGFPCEECHGEGSVAPRTPSSLWEWDGEHCGTEYRTRPTANFSRLSGELRQLASDHRDRGVHDCGFHIHFSVMPGDVSAVDPVKFFEAWQAEKERRIYPLVPKGVGARHSTQWCVLLQPDLSFSDWMNGRQRYSEINSLAMYQHGTIEVRLGGSSEDGEQLVKFLEAVLSLASDCLYPEDMDERRALFQTEEYRQLGSFSNRLALEV